MSLPADLAARVGAAARARGVWFWTALGTGAAILLLWAGTQLAKVNGQSVEWYTGFGQWLGALGSLIAAVVALWIATTDRRRAERMRKDERDEAAADRAREAGLVLVIARRMASAVQISGGESEPAVAIKNRLSSRIHDLKVVRFVQQGSDVADLEFKRFMTLHPTENRWSPTIDRLPTLSLEPDQTLVLYPKDRPEDLLADYVAVRYTDQSGRRWEVDTDGGPGRKVS